eukprot:UC4_evm1s412
MKYRRSRRLVDGDNRHGEADEEHGDHLHNTQNNGEFLRDQDEIQQPSPVSEGRLRRSGRSRERNDEDNEFGISENTSGIKYENTERKNNADLNGDEAKGSFFEKLQSDTLVGAVDSGAEKPSENAATIGKNYSDRRSALAVVESLGRRHTRALSQEIQSMPERRSSRPRKLLHDSFNDSQIFNKYRFRAVSDEEGKEGKSKSASSESSTGSDSDSESESESDSDSDSDANSSSETQSEPGSPEEIYEERVPLREGLRVRKVRVDNNNDGVASTSKKAKKSNSKSKKEPHVRRSLRRERKRTVRYTPPKEEETRSRRKRPRLDDDDDRYEYARISRRRGRNTKVHRNRRHRRHRHRKRSSYNVSTTELSSSSCYDEYSEDESRFRKRKHRSLKQARSSIRPMNIEKISTLDRKDRQRAGSSGTDLAPMNIDASITFSSVGGLASHVRCLKEMIVFPMIYPEIFERFRLDPPRGVLFHGPPGTGKTLMARALANECSKSGQQVSFFMRKGADCLSKWIGESERMLRLLFDQAYAMRPSIIFFDEIDGLAPVRHGRQEQNYSSIVSTLLALMDGLDGRGEVVVIGATNRIDSIDPALRRPGRFDRELRFALPSLEARKQILSIHTRKWRPPVEKLLISELAIRCTGFCGADLKAVCTEAMLCALRRHYPQIYDADRKKKINVASIQVNAGDFMNALTEMTPTSRRGNHSPSKPLLLTLEPLLGEVLRDCMSKIERLIPRAFAERHSMSSMRAIDEIKKGDFAIQAAIGQQFLMKDGCSFDLASRHPHLTPKPHRPALILLGEPGMGLSTQLAPAILHQLEKYPHFVLSIGGLYNDPGFRNPEQVCVNIIKEASRSTPSVLFIPQINIWREVVGEHMISIFRTELMALPSHSEMLVLATYESDKDLENFVNVRDLFYGPVTTIRVVKPSQEQREAYFCEFRAHFSVDPLSCTNPMASPRRGRIRTRRQTQLNDYEDLPDASDDQQIRPGYGLSEEEKKALLQREEATIRKLRMYLRNVLESLMREKKFKKFCEAVDTEVAPDYAEIVKNPMDLSLMMDRLNIGKYTTHKLFLKDIDLIVSNAYLYNPSDTPSGSAIRRNASSLKDDAYNLIDNVEEDDNEKSVLMECIEIYESRQKRQWCYETGPQLIIGQKASMSRPAPLPCIPTELQCDDIIGEDERSEGLQSETNGTGGPIAVDETINNGQIEEQELVIDTARVDEQFSLLINKTAGCNLISLTTIAHKIRSIVYRHRHEWNKSALLNEFDKIIYQI